MPQDVSSSQALKSALGASADLREWFRTKHALMPIVVFTAEQPGSDATASTDDASARDEQITKLVEVMHKLHVAGRLICFSAKSLPPETAEIPEPAANTENQNDSEERLRRQYEKAYELLDTMINPNSWGARDLPRSRRPAFPRSNLIKAIEEASQEEDVREAVNTLRHNRWQSRLQRRRSGLGIQAKQLLDPGNIFGALVLFGLTSFFGDRVRLLALAFLVGLLLFVKYRVIPVQRPQLLWLSQVNRWFSRTTFLTAGQVATEAWSWWNPFVSGRVMTLRAQELAEGFAEVPRPADRRGAGGDGDAEQRPPAWWRPGPLRRSRAGRAATTATGLPGPTGPLSTEEAAQDNDVRLYLLQLRTLALLEDLRTLYLPWRLDLRRRKRPMPPILFLPRATAADGHVALLGAINDVRCRRSEVDPLLVLAGMSRADRTALNDTRDRTNGTSPSSVFSLERFEEWTNGLRLGQSPKGRPWVLERTLGDTLLDLPDSESLRKPKEPKRPLWLKMWSLPTVLVLLVVASGVVGWVGVRYEHRYCGSHHLLYFGNHDLRRVRDVTGTGYECIGVTAAAYPFDTSGFRLDGTTAANPGKDMGHDVTLSTLEKWITASNASIGDSPHITIVYAGPLSVWKGQQPSQMRNGLEELAGVYLAQNFVNSGESDGPKVRVLLANGGQELRRQYLMAQQIVRVAAHDPTIVAVVGLGRDTDDSDRTVKLLQRSGLAVVDTTNSSPTLKSNLNYFGLASTDVEEANALVNRLVTDNRRSGAGKGPLNAFVVTRSPVGTDDEYSQHQKAAAIAALRAAGYHVDPLPYPAGTDTSFARTIDQICDGSASVVYLAGRSDDVSALLSNIAGDKDCSGRKLSLLSGDDLTKLDFVLDDVFVPEGVTVYFAALADPSVTGAHSALVNSEKLVPRLSRYNPTSKNPPQSRSILGQQMFDDGTLAMAFEAAEAVQSAADVSDAVHSGYRSAVQAELAQIDLANQPTGQVEFSRSSQGGDTHHGIVVNRVTEKEGAPTAVCAALSGTSTKDSAPTADQDEVATAGKGKTAAKGGSKAAPGGEDALPTCSLARPVRSASE